MFLRIARVHLNLYCYSNQYWLPPIDDWSQNGWCIYCFLSVLVVFFAPFLHQFCFPWLHSDGNHNGAAVLDIDFFYFDTETQYWYIQMWLHFMEKEDHLNMPTSTNRFKQPGLWILLIFNFHLSIQVFRCFLKKVVPPFHTPKWSFLVGKHPWVCWGNPTILRKPPS